MVNVVIGAGSGMGIAVARALAARGPLVIADRHRGPVDALASELGGDVTAIACDITDQAQVDSLLEQARILSVSPGINDTPMNHLDESRHPIMADIIATSPLGRRGRPEEVADVVDFLTSDRASFMTGSDVLIDGGMVATIPEDSTGGRAGAFAALSPTTSRK